MGGPQGAARDRDARCAVRSGACRSACLSRSRARESRERTVPTGRPSAWAAWLGDTEVRPDHVQAVAELVLVHRRKPGAPQPQQLPSLSCLPTYSARRTVLLPAIP